MLANLDVSVVGSVSGGCLETDVMIHAAEVIRKGKAVLIHYDTTTDSDLIFGSGMGCGGTVDILLEPASSESVQRLMHALELCVYKRTPFAVGTVFSVTDSQTANLGDSMTLMEGRTEITGLSNPVLRSEIQAGLQQVFDARQGGATRFEEQGESVELLFEYVRPPISLLLFGAGDDAIPVSRMATQLGWQVTVVDHRPDRVTNERFPDATALVTARPDDAVGTIKFDEFDAAVVMTHNFQRDKDLLSVLLKSSLKYIGLLGAAKRAERILAEIVGRGVKIEKNIVGRLHAPVGIDLKADGADEIALSIVAEIQMVLAGGTGVSLNTLRGTASSHGPVNAGRVK